MTVPSDPRKAGPYAGDGVLLNFDFNFKVFAATDIAVDYYADADATETRLVLGTDYTVALNPDQDATPGGTISLIGSFIVTPPGVDDRVAISGDLDYLQPLDVTNEDGFLAQNLEDALDRLAMLVQQVNEKVGRALLQPITDTSASPEALILQIQSLHAAVVSIYDAFDDRYLGPKAVAPTLDNDGNALTAGALYFDTVIDQLRVWNDTLSAWQAAAGTAVLRETQTAVDQGGGVHTVFTLSSTTYTPGTNTLRAYSNGVRQYGNFAETDGTTVTFTPGIPAGEKVLFETVEAQAGAVNALNVGVTETGPLVGANLQAILESIGEFVVQPGGIVGYAGGTVPNGWLECDGAAVSRVGYARLFDAIGTTYGSGDGVNTFNIPDLRGEFLRGWDHGRGVDAARALGSAQADEIRSHAHDLKTRSEGQRSPADYNRSQYNLNATTVSGGTTEAEGGVETRPRNVAVMYCIKT